MSMALGAISENLATIVGSQHLITEPQELPSYRIGVRTPNLAIRPGSVEEVAEIVRFAVAEKLAIVPVGSRTKLSMNIPLQRYHIALDVTRLNKMVSYDPADLTLSVEAGMPLQRIEDELAKHRQFLPLAVPFAGRATVGGTIASGADSPLRQAYGTARDFILGMEFVTGEGKIAKSGGRVVKNVSGYDLHKLMIGSFGSLGVITKINFRTFPIAGSIRAFVAVYDSARDALDARHRIVQSPLRPLTLEILNPRAAELLSGVVANRIFPSKFSFDSHWQIIVSYSGTEKTLERYDRDLRQLAGTAKNSVLEESEAPIALSRVREFVSIALESWPPVVIMKVSALPTNLASLLDEASAMATRDGISLAVLARGVGVVYFAILPPEESVDSTERVRGVVEGLGDVCRRHEANIATQWIPEEWGERVRNHSSAEKNFSMMQKMKAAFDPHGVFGSDPCPI